MTRQEIIEALEAGEILVCYDTELPMTATWSSFYRFGEIFVNANEAVLQVDSVHGCAADTATMMLDTADTWEIA